MNGKIRKVRGKESWYIRYCYAGRQSAVHFSKNATDGKYFCYVGADCWLADSFDEAARTCREKIRQIGGFVD